MKHKLLAVSLVLATSSSFAQGIRLATVTHVEPVRHTEVISVPRRVCSAQTVPVYNTVPVVQTYRDPNSIAPVVGLIVGAAIGYHAMGSAPGLGAMLGGSVGYSIGDHARTSHPYWTGQTVSTVTYHNLSSCYVHHETMEVMRTIGYRVTYELDGIKSAVVMATHPGSHIRIVTRVEP